MKTKVLHEKNGYWVMKSTDGYHVMQPESCYSVTESAYPLNPDGLSIAKARCNYLGNRVN